MNYYEHHIGDYDQATAHLTACEDGIYSRLIRWYMASESPLPADIKLIQRRVRAHSREEKSAVQTILDEFFELTDDGYRQHRCDEEIDRYLETIPDREAKRDNARERQKRARARRKELFEALRGHGFVPAFDTKTSELEALLSRVTKRDKSPDVTPPVTRDNTSTQAPDTRHQSEQAAAMDQPEERGAAHAAALPGARPADSVTERSLQLVMLLRPRGAALQTGDPNVRDWAARGVTDAQALQALEIAQQRRHDSGSAAAINAGYLSAILRDVTASATTDGTPRAPRNRDEGRALASGTSLADALAATQLHGGSTDVQHIEAPAP
ncbi:YdaU family protein [Methyloversatilis sp. XJ19-49]|uniref:YdaU family protein n=1 Tax=Methyloversatilis sp. XJ19-49 TaxID=2963429 RepID=UPI00211D0F5F|nr:YdaU family protein [Methyloversatilis sp. XJ19-49]MCQ9378824.1 YdaU family protein [Methyloversatilis sp. XJ19-49]